MEVVLEYNDNTTVDSILDLLKDIKFKFIALTPFENYIAIAIQQDSEVKTYELKKGEKLTITCTI